MRAWGTLLLVLSAGLLQTTLVPRLAIGEVKPDLMLASLVYISLLFGTRYGIWAGFSGGIFVDLFSPRHLGVNGLIYTTICFFLGEIGGRVFRDKALTQFLILAAAALVHNILYVLVSAQPLELLARLLPGSLYTGVLGFVCLQILKRVKLRK